MGTVFRRAIRWKQCIGWTHGCDARSRHARIPFEVWELGVIEMAGLFVLIAFFVGTRMQERTE